MERCANEILEDGLTAVERVPLERALRAGTTHSHDYVRPYVRDLGSALDMKAIAAMAYWDPIAETYGLNIEVVNRQVC